MKVMMQCRRRLLINTDPQRRCYHGVNKSEAIVDTGWEDFFETTKEKSQGEGINNPAWWRELNNEAVKARDESARVDYRIKEIL